GSATPINEGMLLGKASATKVNAPIVVDAPLVIVAARTGRQVRVGRLSTGRRETAQLRGRGAGDRGTRRDGPRSAELQEAFIALPRAVEGRASPAEDIGLLHSEAEAVAVFVAAATAEVFVAVGEAVADVA